MQYKIGGCDVFFPHQAYGVQLSFMSKVIQALEGGDNALLEAPTGWSGAGRGCAAHTSCAEGCLGTQSLSAQSSFRQA